MKKMIAPIIDAAKEILPIIILLYPFYLYVKKGTRRECLNKNPHD